MADADDSSVADDEQHTPGRHDDKNSDTSPSHGDRDELDDHLHIKPPQLQQRGGGGGRREKHHSSKKGRAADGDERKRRSEPSSRGRDRAGRDKSYDDDRKGKKDKNRDPERRQDRERNTDRGQHEDEDDDRRENSRKEWERLEMLERKRSRLERQREQEHRERQQRVDREKERDRSRRKEEVASRRVGGANSRQDGRHRDAARDRRRDRSRSPLTTSSTSSRSREKPDVRSMARKRSPRPDHKGDSDRYKSSSSSSRQQDERRRTERTREEGRGGDNLHGNRDDDDDSAERPRRRRREEEEEEEEEPMQHSGDEEEGDEDDRKTARQHHDQHRSDEEEQEDDHSEEEDEDKSRRRRAAVKEREEEEEESENSSEEEEGRRDEEEEEGEHSESESEGAESYASHASSVSANSENEETEDRPKAPPRPDKIRSKFDDESEEDEESDVASQPMERADDGEDEDDDAYHYLDDTPPPSPIELKPELPPYYPAIQGCRSVEEFHCLNRIEEGTYGVVFRARDKKLDEIVALKKLKMEKEKEGFPITSLREISTLLKSQHTNIVTVREIVVGSNMDKIYIVMDYVEHDLKGLMETMKAPFISGEVKTLMIQLLRGVTHLHDNWIIHRDLKTSNLLLSHKGILKIGDFGLAREYVSPLKPYTPIVVTLWYRAPELLLGCKEYSTHIDMWSVGCIFAEFLTQKPLFPGKSEIDQLNRIFKELGTPSEKIWPGVGELPAMKKCTFTQHPYNQLRNRFGSTLSQNGFDLLNRFLTYNPQRRVTAEDALKHDYFTEVPLPVPPSMFPTWPAKSEQSRSSRRGNSPKPPSGGKAFAKLLEDDDNIGGFHLSHATKGASAQGPGFSLKF